MGMGAGVGLLLGGSAILVGRVLGYRWDGLSIAIGLGLGLLWAGRRYWARKVSKEQVAVWLDLKQGGDGRLLHQWEGGPTAVQQMEQPRLRPDYTRLARTFLPGLAFCLITVLVPVRTANAASPLDPLMERRLEEVQELAAALEETLELKEEVRDEIEENLAALEEATERETPSAEAMREALDQFESRLEDIAEQEADRLERSAQESADAAMQALSADPEMRSQALEQLSEMAAQMEQDKMLSESDFEKQIMDKLREEGLSEEAMEALQELLDASSLSEMGDSMESMNLTPEQAARLAQAMAEGLSKEALEKLAELAEKGLLKPGQGSGQGRMATAEEIEEFLRRLEEQEPGGS